MWSFIFFTRVYSNCSMINQGEHFGVSTTTCVSMLCFERSDLRNPQNVSTILCFPTVNLVLLLQDLEFLYVCGALIRLYQQYIMTTSVWLTFCEGEKEEITGLYDRTKSRSDPGNSSATPHLPSHRGRQSTSQTTPLCAFVLQHWKKTSTSSFQ